MMRSFLLALSKANWAQRLATRSRLGRRMAGRFVAGESADDAIGAASALNARGILVTLDHLGENTTNPVEAEQATTAVLEMLDTIQGAGVRANVSIKLSQIGLALDKELGCKNLSCIVERAQSLGNFIRIDMEDASLTEATLDAYSRMRDLGFDNLGVVIQAYLYRSEGDVENILARQGRVRLCKGAYREPPHVAFPAKSDVDANYDRLARRLIDAAQDPRAPAVSGDGRFPPIAALATHDPQRIDRAKAHIQAAGLPRQSIEFQMLYGIRRDLQESLAREGYPLRVYVPYGRHWYPYFMRRLAERPANMWFILKNVMRE